VLVGNGRILVVAPNRSGMWAQTEVTPFGWGHPYSPSQLSRLLRDHMFTPERTAHALYVPPTRSRALLRSAVAWERIGVPWFPRFAGVVMIEAGKQLYAAGVQREKKRYRRPVLVPLPQTASRGRNRVRIKRDRIQSGPSRPGAPR
jgi:hypothetical protein